jgi:very-short-patch-repair endonuclease
VSRYNNLPNLKPNRIALRKNYTDAELFLWTKLRYRQLGVKFRRQHSIGPYVLDFYCPEKRLAIELDGGQHNSEEIKIYDDERTIYLRSFGVKVLRFWNNDVLKSSKEVLEVIYNTIIQTPSWSPPSQGEKENS